MPITLRSAARNAFLFSCCCSLSVLTFAAGSRAQQFLEPKQLQHITVGEIVAVKNLVRRPFDAVCVLYPYQPWLHEREPLSQKVNAHLVAVKYVADEGHWAFVFVDGPTVTVEKFARPPDIASGDASLPRTFKARSC